MSKPADSDHPGTRAAAWHRQPVVWLGIVVFLASIAGCVWIIVVGMQYADTPLDANRGVLGVPVAPHSAPATSSSSGPVR